MSGLGMITPAPFSTWMHHRKAWKWYGNPNIIADLFAPSTKSLQRRTLSVSATFHTDHFFLAGGSCEG